MSIRIVTLAAGKGTRMGADVPKCLVEIAGRPMVEHMRDNIADADVDQQPILVISPDATSLFQSTCGDAWEYVVQDEQLGTGHAVMSAQDAANGAEHIIVLYGDHPFLSSEKIAELAELHSESNAVLSMVTTKVPNFEKDHSGFKSWGRILRDNSGKVIAIREAKDATDDELAITEVNPSLFAFNAQWLWDHLPELQNKNAAGEYYLTDLIEMAIDEGHDIATTTAEPFEVIGVNTPEELDRVEQLLG